MRIREYVKNMMELTPPETPPAIRDECVLEWIDRRETIKDLSHVQELAKAGAAIERLEKRQVWADRKLREVMRRLESRGDKILAEQIRRVIDAAIKR